MYACMYVCNVCLYVCMRVIVLLQFNILLHSYSLTIATCGLQFEVVSKSNGFHAPFGFDRAPSIPPGLDKIQATNARRLSRNLLRISILHRLPFKNHQIQAVSQFQILF